VTSAPPTTMVSSSPSVAATSFAVPPTTPTKTYTSKTDGYQLDYPAKWTVHNKGGECTTTVCFAAPEQDGQVPAVIAVNSFTGTTPTTLQTAWNTQRQLAINSLGVQPKTVSGTQGNTTLGGEQAKTATYTLNFGMIPATARQTMVLTSDGLTAIWLSEMSSTDIWSKLDPSFKQVEESFTLTG
jgi:hypothetical protein